LVSPVHQLHKGTYRVKFWGVVSIGLVSLLLLCCGHQQAKSKQCFDDIRQTVQGRTAAEVERILGKPDSRQPMVLTGERWVWWNYTFLDGRDYPPEERGRVVHLEILFEREGKARSVSGASLSDLRATDPLGVSYTLSAE
jgi:hypothetical protein